MSTCSEQGHRWFAVLYDRMMGPVERRVMQPLRRRLVELTGSVLEIGAGTGANLAHYAAAAEVVGIEPDPFMLKPARARLEELNRSNITLQQAGAENLPFPDHGFDHVVSTLVLCTVADPEKALAEIRRVLKPDGELHFIEHVRGEGWLDRGQDIIQPVYSHFTGGCMPNRRTKELIETAGFRIEQLTTRTIQFGTPLLAGTARPV